MNIDLLIFALIGLTLVIIGSIISLFGQSAPSWALIGSGLAIIWISFHTEYHKKG